MQNSIDEFGLLHAYEFKWNDKKQKAPKAWLENYADASYQLINRTNYHEFLIPEDSSLL